MKVELQEVLQGYELKDIWNCDETALFWHLEPCKTIAHTPVLGKKHSKEHVSILVTCNASGDEKLPLVYIHKYEIPHALIGIEKDLFLFGIIGIQKLGCKEVFLSINLKD